MPTHASLAAEWTLDPAVDFLNHGSFGACPRAVLAYQQTLRDAIERQPVLFLDRQLPELFDAARIEVAAFLGADPEGLVVVPNATSAVSTVLRSLAEELRAGDELLTTDHAYNACRNALDFVAARTGARLVVVPVPFPLAHEDLFVERLLGAATPRTRIALLDHVTSPTGIVLPVERLIAELAPRGVDVLIDGAHAPGQLPLDLGTLGATWYTGNCHKWLCAPKGAAILWAREDRREALRPLVVSHGYNTRRPGRSRLHDEFDWPGTGDPTPFLCVPLAIRTLAGLVTGGWPELLRRNHALALQARDTLARALAIAPPAPDSMVGSMAAVPLPDAPPGAPSDPDPVKAALWDRHAIEVPVFSWPQPPRRVLRASAQLYNEPAQYERLAAAVVALLAEEAAGGGYHGTAAVHDAPPLTGSER